MILTYLESWRAMFEFESQVRPARIPRAGYGRRGGTACAGLPAVGEPPPLSALGMPRPPAAATRDHLPAVETIYRPAMTSADLTRCEDRFRMLFKLQDSHQVSTAEAAAMLHASGFSPDVCAEILHDMVPASPDQCTTIPTPISLFAEPGECGASGAHCAPPNDTALMGMSSPLLPSSANTPNAKTPRRHLAFRPTTIGSLPPGSPLLQPATTCAPWRTTSLAASAAIGIDDLSTMEMADRSAAIPITISPLPPGSPLLKPATMCVPQRTTGMAASDAIGIDDELLTLETAAHAVAIPITIGPLPPGSPLLKPATMCAPQRTTGLAASDAIGIDDELSNETADRMAIPITIGPLPPGSPLLKPATMCVPQRTTGLAASDAIGIDDGLSTLETADSAVAICTDPMGRLIVPDGAGRLPSMAMHACKDGARHDTDPNSLLPSVSPLPKLERPLRIQNVMVNGMCTRSWGEASAIRMADCGTLPDDILQVFLPQARRTSRQFLRTSLAEWGLTLCHLLCDTSMARSRAFWEYEVQLATRHSDERHTLANAEAVLGFYVFGLACSGYFVRRDNGPFLGDRVDHDIHDGIMALECAKAHELPEYRACLLSVLAAFECNLWMAPGDEGHLQALRAFDAQLKALLAMAPARRYRAKGPPTHRHGLTLDGQLDLHSG